MKASELVALLNAEIEKYGDAEVFHYDRRGNDLNTMFVSSYNIEGLTPNEDKSNTKQIVIY